MNIMGGGGGGGGGGLTINDLSKLTKSYEQTDHLYNNINNK